MTKTIDFPNIGYTIQWLFKDEDNDIYSDYNTIGVAHERIYEDLHIILTQFMESRLLLPVQLTQTGNFGCAGLQTDQIVEEIRQLVRSRIITQQLDIYGYGYVKMPGGEEIMQPDLIQLTDFRFTERSFKITTFKNVWTPVATHDEDNFSWQIDLAELNAPRLEHCLSAIYHKIKLPVTPGPEEEIRSHPIWQKGFKLFPSREIIESAYNEDPPPPNFDIAKYLLPK
ncbi:hypothetical protein [Chitinophaga solisilvae]|uniref:Uncharacterized protein n=1 Tax=Chitinophaga solisilvae TaxID=1233460 RepID=A0A3S1AUX0_9BACT|nr:hypothetical protein [Chitinophaga solisilvae]NSL88752.1 hypothetical protein [Chitinophaga solisilvae]